MRSPMTEQTFVIIKPDAVAAGHVGAIVCRYEAAGLAIEAMELRSIDGAFADRHYAAHVEKAFYPPLRTFMTSGPLVAMVLAGADAVAEKRTCGFLTRKSWRTSRMRSGASRDSGFSRSRTKRASSSSTVASSASHSA